VEFFKQGDLSRLFFHHFTGFPIAIDIRWATTEAQNKTTKESLVVSLLLLS
jgi:hypothetical protein